MKRDSLKGTLLRWVLGPLAVVVAVNLWTSYRNARGTADLVTDRTLEASVRSIAEHISVEQDLITAQIPPSALEMFNTGYGDHVYYRVEADDGRLLAGYGDVPLPQERGTLSQPFGYRQSYRSRPMRLIAMEYPVIGAEPVASVLVAVGVTLKARNAMLQDIWLTAAVQQFILLVIAGGMVGIGLTRGLAPLISLRDAVLRRDDGDMKPFSESTQSELRPLIAALNNYMQRVRDQIEAQRRFIANAAHQLKTPLALLATQAAFAQRTQAEHEREEALAALQANTMTTARLVSQLLVLSRAEPRSASHPVGSVDMAGTARAVLDDFAATALKLSIELGFEEQGVPALVLGDAILLREMLVNLIDNALRYTPAGGSATLSLSVDGETCRIVVEDTGPGIPAEERSHVFERFYRTPGSSGGGSGLGLAIVREIAEAAGGAVVLADGKDRIGLAVEVTLPLAGAFCDPFESQKALKPERR